MTIYDFTAKGRKDKDGNIVKRLHPTTPPEEIDTAIAALI